MCVIFYPTATLIGLLARRCSIMSNVICRLRAEAIADFQKAKKKIEIKFWIQIRPLSNGKSSSKPFFSKFAFRSLDESSNFETIERVQVGLSEFGASKSEVFRRFFQLKASKLKAASCRKSSRKSSKKSSRKSSKKIHPNFKNFWKVPESFESSSYSKKVKLFDLTGTSAVAMAF